MHAEFNLYKMHRRKSKDIHAEADLNGKNSSAIQFKVIFGHISGDERVKCKIEHDEY